MKIKIIYALLSMSIFIITGCGDAARTNTSSSKRGNVNTNSDFKLPLFPFPPNASVDYPIDASLITNQSGETTFGFVDDRLKQALGVNGYEQVGYYAVAGGFVMTTATEQFESTGRPAARNRFSEIQSPPSAFSVEFWSNALKGKTGRFRIIAFMITNQNFIETNETPSYSAGRNLIVGGAKFLPTEMRSLPFTGDHRCLALIYEYGQDRRTGEIKYVRPGTLAAKMHLNSLLNALK